MSRPVHRPPGSFYLFSRRVDRKESRLRPGQSFQDAIGLLIASAAKAFDIKIAHLVIMSNHLHIVFWDPHGLASDFVRQAMSNIARLVNFEQGRSGQFWQREDGRSLKALRDLGAVIDAVAYCYLNPTEAELVPHPSAWPGLNTDPAQIGVGEAQTFERENTFFAEDGVVPLSESLVLELPDHVDASSFRAEVLAIVERKVAAIEARVLASGGRFAGREAVLAVDIFSAPEPPLASAGPGERVARVAARDPEVMKHALEQLLTFEREYAECRRRLAEGKKRVTFPAGTYHLWRHRGAKREAGPPPEHVFRPR